MEAIRVERDAGLVTITLDRPDKKNAFNAEVLCRLCDAWDMIDADDDVRAAIMTGAGGNFSAGADLDRLVGALLSGKPAEDEFEERIRQDFSLIYKGFLKEFRPATPIIAAVEGYCYAGGIEILSCKHGDTFVQWTAGGELHVGLAEPDVVRLPEQAWQKLDAARKALDVPTAMGTVVCDAMRLRWAEPEVHAKAAPQSLPAPVAEWLTHLARAIEEAGQPDLAAALRTGLEQFAPR